MSERGKKKLIYKYHTTRTRKTEKTIKLYLKCEKYTIKKHIRMSLHTIYRKRNHLLEGKVSVNIYFKYNNPLSHKTLFF